MQSGKQNFVQQVGTLWVVVRWRQEAAQAGILKPVQLPVFGGVPVALSDAKIWGPPYTKSTEAETQRLIYLHTHHQTTSNYDNKCKSSGTQVSLWRPNISQDPATAVIAPKACPDVDGKTCRFSNHICAQSAHHAPGLVSGKHNDTDKS